MGRMKEEFMQMKLQEQQDARDIMEKHHPIGQERYVDEAEFKRNEIIDAMHNIEQQPSINKLNNKMAKKTMQEKLTPQVKETKEETLKRLFLANGLVKEDVYKDQRGFVIITRTGIDKIVSKQNIAIAYEPVIMTEEWVVLKATASIDGGAKNSRVVMSFGEASDKNLMGGGKKFPVAMAEKRAMSRVVLKLTGFYEQGVFGQDEIVD
jgi:hypothetical protein